MAVGEEDEEVLRKSVLSRYSSHLLSLRSGGMGIWGCEAPGLELAVEFEPFEPLLLDLALPFCSLRRAGLPGLRVSHGGRSILGDFLAAR